MKVLKKNDSRENESSIEIEKFSLFETEEISEVVVSSTSNFIVKNFEKYLLLMNLIRPNAIEIFTGLVSTFEFFVTFLFKQLFKLSYTRL